MPISYKKLFHLLESRNLSATYWLRQHGIHPATVNKLRKNERVNTDTISEICKLLNCQPGDIMEYIPDKKDAPVHEPIHRANTFCGNIADAVFKRDSVQSLYRTNNSARALQSDSSDIKKDSSTKE